MKLWRIKNWTTFRSLKVWKVWKFERLKFESPWARGPGPNWGSKLWFTFGESIQVESHFQTFKISGFEIPGPGAWGPTGGPSYGLPLESRYTWRVPSRLSKFQTPGPGPGAQLGTQARVFPWRVCTRGKSFSNFQNFFPTFKVWTSFQTVKLSNFPLRTVSNFGFSKAREFKSLRNLYFLSLYSNILYNRIYSQSLYLLCILLYYSIRYSHS